MQLSCRISELCCGLLVFWQPTLHNTSPCHSVSSPIHSLWNLLSLLLTSTTSWQYVNSCQNQPYEAEVKVFWKKKEKKSAVAISPWYWTSLAKKIYKLSYKEKPNAIGSTIHISTCKSTFPLCELQTLNTERWSSLICRHKNQSSSEVVNYIFVQSKERAGTEKSDLYRSGFYLCKLSRTPGVYTELYIEVWITV